MTAYYNEIDGYAAAWLRNLISAGLIAPGEVDERSIVDVRPDDLRGYTQCHFFAGLGGWSRAARLAGWSDARPVWTGSCPCQPFSLAGKQKGFADDRHLWPVWRGLVRECAPPVVFGEQVASATEWLGLVRSDLEEMGYAVGAMPVQAASAGADHSRDRFWFVADTDGQRGEAGLSGPISGQEGYTGEPDDHSREISVADTHESRQGQGWEQRSGELGGPGGYPQTCHVGDSGDELRQRHAGSFPRSQTQERGEDRAVDGDSHLGPQYAGEGAFEWLVGADGKARRVKPGIRLLAHGVPNRVAKLRAFGNAIDPRPAAEFIGAYLDLASLNSDAAA